MTAHINCLNVSSVVQWLDVFWYSIFHFFPLVLALFSCRLGTLMSMSGCLWVCVKCFVITMCVCAHMLVCMKCVWADLPISLQSLHHQKKGRSCYQMVKQTHHPTAHNSDPFSVHCQGCEGKQRDVLLLILLLLFSSPLLSPHFLLLPSHYTLQGNENRMGKMEWNPSLCVFNCNQWAHLSMLASLCPRCIE